MSEHQAQINAVLAQLDEVILGKPLQLRLCLACLLARGHLLIEDVPGVGKTILAHALARTLGLSLQRIQFTSDLLPADERDRARRETRTRLRRLSPGAWNVAESVEPDSHHRGFLIIDGLISREVEVLGRRCVELLGAADVIRPWSWDEDGSHVKAEVGWIVLEPSRMAVLDHRLITRINPWPQLGLELFSRGMRRAHALAISLAIAHHQRVDDRLRLTLWHLAERWGRVLPEGIALSLPLSHQRLADLGPVE